MKDLSIVLNPSHKIVTYYYMYNVTKNLQRLCLSAKYTFMDR